MKGSVGNNKTSSKAHREEMGVIWGVERPTHYMSNGAPLYRRVQEAMRSTKEELK
jgi:hypothetical protein